MDSSSSAFPIVLSGILAVIGLVIAIVWIIFPFLVLKRLDRAAEEAARQTKLLNEISGTARRSIEGVLRDILQVQVLQSKDPQMVFRHAKRHYTATSFPEGEGVMALDAQTAFDYAVEILAAPFPAGEAAIAKDGKLACKYALRVLGGRFPLGEPAIFADPDAKRDYVKGVPKPGAGRTEAAN